MVVNSSVTQSNDNGCEKTDMMVNVCVNCYSYLMLREISLSLGNPAVYPILRYMFAYPTTLSSLPRLMRASAIGRRAVLEQKKKRL